MRSYFFSFITLKFHPTNPKAMDRHSLGACAEVGLTFNLIVALESICLTRDPSGRVEPKQLKNDCLILKKLSNMYLCKK